MTRWILRIGYVAIVAVVILSAIAIYQGIVAARHGKETLQATLLVVDLIKQHVETHDGAWPGSWADLEKITPPRSSIYEWPADLQQVQQRVEVDFAADPRQIAQQTPEEFKAVLPIGYYYTYKDKGSVQALIDAVGEHQ
ncbi:hypothetical protein NG895_11000 [Aeoliella sp. ICT_H6.2]|uniref:Uncharacterized protein n=1 Tax=Aeoliella straminimaris TaxID=2954799 RepID=A0A9X2FA53_9BACT|nr:hypothetical protein [Aeoliella straminimaris]MCO6044433.1 hypothetical protein [Aeoliella straminimaris]